MKIVTTKDGDIRRTPPKYLLTTELKIGLLAYHVWIMR